MDAIAYWKQAIYDYISCLSDNDEFEDISEEKVNEIVNSILNDDYLWSEIDQTIDYYLGRKIYEKC